VRPPAERDVLPWLATLSSAGISYCVESDGLGWAVWVPAQEAERAIMELREYRRVNRGWPPPETVLPYSGDEVAAPTLVSLAVAFGLVLFHRCTGAYSASVSFFAVGNADSARIVAGEWWRAVTALTLHSDAGHVLANSLCCVGFGTAVCRQVGSGVAWGLIVLTGVVANGLAAYTVAPGRAAVGASTATFGALGILAGLQLVRNLRSSTLSRSHRCWGRVWLPLGAAAGLLALLGTGARSDLAGHLWGVVVGVLVGGAASASPGPASQAIQVGCTVVWVGLVGGAWWAAFSTL